MDDPAGVRVRERVTERGADPQDVAVGQRAGLDEIGERRAADELGDEVDRLVVAARLVERDDARMLQPRGSERLALRARGDMLVVQLDPLDGDGPVQSLVVREPDDSERARAEAPNQSVAVEREPRIPRAPQVGRRQRVVGGLHHLPPSPPQSALPPARGRRSDVDGKLAGWPATGHVVILRPGARRGRPSNHVLL